MKPATYYRRWKRVIALLGDTHIGSQVALFPPKWTPEQGSTVPANEGQRKIWDFWEEFVRWVNWFRADTVLHLGDVIEGRQEAGTGELLCLPHIDGQIACAADVLSALCCRNRMVGILSGSQYHDSRDISIARAVATALDRRHCRAKYLGYVATLTISGTPYTINVAHIASGAVYRGTAGDQQIVWAMVARAFNQLPDVHIIARAHIHSDYYSRTRDRHYIIVPGWKAWDPYVPAIRNYPRMQPSIGGGVLAIDACNNVVYHPMLMPNVPHILDTIGDA